MGISNTFLTHLPFRRKRGEDVKAGTTTTTDIPTESNTPDSETIPFIADGEIISVLPSNIANGCDYGTTIGEFDITPTEDISVTLLLKTLNSQYGLFGDDKRPNTAHFVSVDERYIASGKSESVNSYIITHPAGGWEAGQHELVIRMTDFAHSHAIIEEKKIVFNVEE